MESLENIAKHKESNEDCPFCPGKEEEDFKTYPGASNNSKKLAKIMDAPSRLTQQQGGCRPKDGTDNRQSPAERKPKPTPIFNDAIYGDYSCEAHHAISGKQAMKNHKIEKWILKAKGLVEKDTGYSINNSDNGVWLPSIPEEHKGGKWGLLGPEKKYEIATKPMAQNKGQFHKGPHDITDPEDPYGKYHPSYKKELIDKLDTLYDRIQAWSSNCFLCEDVDPNEGPFLPPYKVNQMLDTLSGSVIKDLVASPKSWRYFISKIAMLYHNEDCPHKHIDL